MDKMQLIQSAVKARKAAYAPYSDCTVGAALLTADGEIYCGANIENAAFSPTVCAERVAMFKAVNDGKRDFAALAVVGGKNGSIDARFSPCGVCRQVLAEFCDKDMPIYLVTGENDCIETTLGDLLPFAFAKEAVK